MQRRWLAAALLVVVLAVGAWLRFESLGKPSFWLDESLGYQLTTSAASNHWWQWLIGFDPEHGPLYYATELAGRFAPSPETAARLAPALFGAATLAVLFFATGDMLFGFVAAALLATNPLHVYYSREARPYALSMLLAAGLLAALLRSKPWIVALLAIAAIYTSATNVPLVLATMILWSGARLGRRAFRPAAEAAAAPLCALLFVPLLYRGSAHATETFKPINATFFAELARSFTVSRGHAAIEFLLLAVIGAVSLARHARQKTIIIIGMALLPIAIGLAALWTINHWYHVRYVCTALPAFMLLVAAGIVALSELAGRFRWIVAIVIVIIFASQTLPAARREPYQKLDWRLIASTIWSHSHDGDFVAAAEPWSYASLGFYLQRLPPRVRLVQVSDPRDVDAVTARQGVVWIVNSGTYFQPWTCRYPIVLTGSLESFHLHYAPSLRHFVQTRAGAAEAQAMRAAGPIRIGAGDDLFRGDGWAGAEGTMRWAVGRRATIIVPGPYEAICFRASPMSGRTPQTMRVLLNGVPRAELTLADGWHDYSAPLSGWKDGMNVIAFDFARATAPADISPSFTDRRPLSAAFETISLGTGDEPARTIRLAAFVDPPSPKTRFPPPPPALLGRLGFETPIAIEDAAQSIASGSLCEDDLTFIRRAYALLLQRTPNALEQASLLNMLKTKSREAVVAHILKNIWAFRTGPPAASVYY